MNHTHAYAHSWIPSVNSKCPECNGPMDLCEYSSCRVYRCAKCGEFDSWMEYPYLRFKKVLDKPNGS